MHIETRRRNDAWLACVDARPAESATPSAGEAVGAAPPPVLVGKLWGRFRKEHDLELHVRTGWLFGTEFVQLLDFVPSTGVYGNELLTHTGLLSELTERFSALVRHRGAQ